MAALVLGVLGAAVPLAARQRWPIGEPGLRSVLAVTVPLHAALPAGLWLAHRSVAATVWTVFGLHAVGAGALVGAFPWWRHRVPELLLVLVANHLATFLVGSLLLR